MSVKLCECGCGIEVKLGRRFVRGHNVRVNHPMSRGEVVAEVMKTKRENGTFQRLSETMSGKNNPSKRPEVVAKMVETSKERGHHQRLSERMLGENHPNWKGGIAVEPYCEIWLDNEFKESIKERDNYECQNPYCWGNCKHLSLDIHHVDYDKKNCVPWNLITLCRGCNARANFNRRYWKGLYQRIVRYAS